jgi:hypothetical protein
VRVKGCRFVCGGGYFQTGERNGGSIDWSLLAGGTRWPYDTVECVQYYGDRCMTGSAATIVGGSKKKRWMNSGSSWQFHMCVGAWNLHSREEDRSQR